MSNTWEEIEQASSEQRHEIHLNGEVISDKLKKNDMKLPSALFELSALNYLEISDTTLTHVPQEMSKLTNLINLALHRNKIEKVDEFFNDLPKLKFFDISFNELTCLPDNLVLNPVHTLNLSNNKLNKLGNMSSAVNLSILHVEHNELTELPEGLEKLPHLLEIHAGNNLLNVLPEDFNNYPAIKLLDLSGNKLHNVPHSLSLCQRMKTLKLEDNPLKDNRLRKMTTQCNTKAILDYIGKQSSGDGGKGKGKKGKKGKNTQKSEEVEDSNVRKILITPNTDEEKRVICDASIKDVRPYICCTVIKNLDLSDDGVFKQFLSLQTKLHENECDMRTRATIATHNASELQFPLTYKASNVEHTQIHALGKNAKSDAASLIQKLKDERDALKQKKKRQPKSGLYKFIELVDGKELIASVRNKDGDVISLPPITNGEKTKITSSVGDVFIEITSPVSIAQTKYVMEELIKKMFQLNFNSVMEGDGEGLCIEPIRVVDENEDLRIVYPSKIDLDYPNILVSRN